MALLCLNPGYDALESEPGGQMGPHPPFMGVTAGHPERSGGSLDRPSLPYRGLADAEVLDAAREVYSQLQATPRWHADNDRLIRQWGLVCQELGLRGITDDITTED
jgi:hypothetical protein